MMLSKKNILNTSLLTALFVAYTFNCKNSVFRIPFVVIPFNATPQKRTNKSSPPFRLNRITARWETTRRCSRQISGAVHLTCLRDTCHGRIIYLVFVITWSIYCDVLSSTVFVRCVNNEKSENALCTNRPLTRGFYGNTWMEITLQIPLTAPRYW